MFRLRRRRRCCSGRKIFCNGISGEIEVEDGEAEAEVRFRTKQLPEKLVKKSQKANRDGSFKKAEILKRAEIERKGPSWFANRAKLISDFCQFWSTRKKCWIIF